MFELEGLLDDMKSNYSIDTLVIGKIATKLEHVQLEQICKKVGLKLVLPLKKTNRSKALAAVVAAGYSVVLTSVNGVDSMWLGQVVDISRAEEISEIAEFETIVVDGPDFKEKIEITVGYPEIQGDTMGTYHVKGLKLSEK
jgi:diphthamide synthase (EF-2-diphthine--ammonia ligase)